MSCGDWSDSKNLQHTGVTIPTASGMVRPRDSEAEEGSDIGAAISKRKSHDSVQPVKESKGAKMLRMASGK